MIEFYIRGLDDPVPELDGMPATRELWGSEDPYDIEGTNEVFLESIRENLRLHSACPFYADWLERNGFSVDDLKTIEDIAKIPPIHANFYKTHTIRTAPEEDIRLTLT